MIEDIAQEALDSYLRDLGEEEIAALLELEGTLGECDEAELRARQPQALRPGRRVAAR